MIRGIEDIEVEVYRLLRAAECTHQDSEAERQHYIAEIDIIDEQDFDLLHIAEWQYEMQIARGTMRTVSNVEQHKIAARQEMQNTISLSQTERLVRLHERERLCYELKHQKSFPDARIRVIAPAEQDVIFSPVDRIKNEMQKLVPGACIQLSHTFLNAMRAKTNGVEERERAVKAYAQETLANYDAVICVGAPKEGLGEDLVEELKANASAVPLVIFAEEMTRDLRVAKALGRIKVATNIRDVEEMVAEVVEAKLEQRGAISPSERKIIEEANVDCIAMMLETGVNLHTLASLSLHAWNKRKDALAKALSNTVRIHECIKAGGDLSGLNIASGQYFPGAIVDEVRTGFLFGDAPGKEDVQFEL